MIRNIIFDIGNVVLSFQPKQYFTKMFNNEEFANAICKQMMGSQTWKDYDLGILTLDEVKDNFQKELPQYHTLIAQMLAVWVEILEPINYTLDKINQYKEEGYQIYLLSNLNKEAYAYIAEHYSLFEDVDGYILSFEEQLAKPDQAIYERLCNRYNLQANQCLFLDDLIENVEAARNYGMQAIHFVSIEEVDKQLQKILENIC